MGTGTFLGNTYETLRVTLGAIFGVLTSLPVGGGGSCNTPNHSTRLKLSQAPGGEATYHAADFTSAP